MRPLPVLQLVAQVNLIVVSELKANVKPQKLSTLINWNSSFYSQPFDICKSLRQLNPVEQAKAHGVAVATFRKCGPSIILPYAQRYNFPAFGELFFPDELKVIARVCF